MGQSDRSVVIRVVRRLTPQSVIDELQWAIQRAETSTVTSAAILITLPDGTTEYRAVYDSRRDLSDLIAGTAILFADLRDSQRE